MSARLMAKLVMVLSFVLPSAAVAEELIARDVFRMLPTTIFDNTLEGMPETEQRRLLEYGETEFWQLRNEGHDKLDVVSSPPGDSHVVVRVFRGDKQGAVAVVGTLGAGLCSVEVWRADSNGRIVPVDTPDEPNIKEFFTPEHKLPKGVEPSMLFCAIDEGLEARPVFWNATGMVSMPVDFQVRYVWEGGQFKKNVTPLATQ